MTLGRVEAVHVETEEQAIAGGGLIVQPGRITQSLRFLVVGPDGVQRVDSARYLLQVCRIVRVRREIGAWLRQVIGTGQ